jgi:hypothetical protein
VGGFVTLVLYIQVDDVAVAQKVNVLSYPATVIKLTEVVGSFVVATNENCQIWSFDSAVVIFEELA